MTERKAKLTQHPNGFLVLKRGSFDLYSCTVNNHSPRHRSPRPLPQYHRRKEDEGYKSTQPII